MQRLSTLRFTPLLLLLSLLLGCGGGSGGGGGEDTTSQGGTANQGSVTVPVPTGRATLALRVSNSIPGAQQVALEDSLEGVQRVLAFFSSPAFAQTVFFTLPGARVDALGQTFTVANADGVADFFSLPARPYVFLITTATPGVSFLTALNIQPGEQLSATVDEFTTMATLLGGGEGADLQALVDLFRAGTNPRFEAVRQNVEAKLRGGQSWLSPVQPTPTDPVLIAALQAAGDDVAFVRQTVPLAAGLNYPTTPLYLILGFNKSIDVSSLGLDTGGWSLTTPTGQINAGNIGQFGTVEYLTSERVLDGRVFSANQLLFTLSNLSLPAGGPVDITLSLPALPRDLSGNPVLSSRPAEQFARWRFTPGGATIPGARVESNVVPAMRLGASACQGPTSADISEFPTPAVFALGDFRPDRLRFQWHDSNLAVSPRERRLELVLQDTQSIQVGDRFSANLHLIEIVGPGQPAPTAEEFRLTYTELDYNGQPGAGPTTAGAWGAVSGEVEVVSLGSGVITLDFDNITLTGPPGDGFCIDGELELRFP